MLLEKALFGAARQAAFLARVRERFPFVYARELTRSPGGRSVPVLQLGQGRTKVLIVGGHHANESITSLLCWRLLEDYCAALEADGDFGGVRASRLYYNAVLYLVPLLKSGRGRADAGRRGGCRRAVAGGTVPGHFLPAGLEG